jgi:tRNA A37 threonylcarbamoyladenosine modification protein TsaB
MMFCWMAFASPCLEGLKMLLAIDTSTAQVGLALYDGDQVLGEMTWSTRQHHTTELARLFPDF